MSAIKDEIQRSIGNESAGTPAGKDSNLIVARSGRLVVMLADIGWEMGSGQQDTIRGLIDAALRPAVAGRQ